MINTHLHHHLLSVSLVLYQLSNLPIELGVRRNIHKSCKVCFKMSKGCFSKIAFVYYEQVQKNLDILMKSFKSFRLNLKFMMFFVAGLLSS